MTTKNGMKLNLLVCEGNCKMGDFNVPPKISIGFQNRSDTYTGKLGFVVRTSKNGKISSEKSWNGWRDDKIKPLVVDNEPTEGFVLNKGVGGARNSYSWNARNEYIRVYDPRGFEFEITVPNLLFILQECSAIKGKDLRESLCMLGAVRLRSCFFRLIRRSISHHLI